jgi:riboflavin synthase
MFTGIIRGVGRVAAIERAEEYARLSIDAGRLGLDDVKLGDSIAVSGACLTVVAVGGNRFEVDVAAETLALTTLGALEIGDAVNLEKALRVSDRLGGHLVSGHVDGVGEVVLREDLEEAVRFRIRTPRDIAKYVAYKGSICVDGVSLTINIVEDVDFEVLIIPHTLEETNMGEFREGRRVNLEVDLIARYLDRLIAFGEVDDPRTAPPPARGGG